MLVNQHLSSVRGVHLDVLVQDFAVDHGLVKGRVPILRQDRILVGQMLGGPGFLQALDDALATPEAIVELLGIDDGNIGRVVGQDLAELVLEPPGSIVELTDVDEFLGSFSPLSVIVEIVLG